MYVLTYKQAGAACKRTHTLFVFVCAFSLGAHDLELCLANKYATSLPGDSDAGYTKTAYQECSMFKLELSFGKCVDTKTPEAILRVCNCNMFSYTMNKCNN